MIRRGGRHGPRRPNASEETIQQVAMLSAAGKSVRQVAEATSVPASTVGRWILRDDVRQVIIEARARIAARLAVLVEQYLDRVEAGEETLSGTPLLVQYGISQDKYDKVDAPPAPNPTLVIVIPGLEGHAESIHTYPHRPTLPAITEPRAEPDQGP